MHTTNRHLLRAPSAHGLQAVASDRDMRVVQLNKVGDKAVAGRQQVGKGKVGRRRRPNSGRIVFEVSDLDGGASMAHVP